MSSPAKPSGSEAEETKLDSSTSPVGKQEENTKNEAEKSRKEKRRGKKRKTPKIKYDANILKDIVAELSRPATENIPSRVYRKRPLDNGYYMPEPKKQKMTPEIYFANPNEYMPKFIYNHHLDVNYHLYDTKRALQKKLKDAVKGDICKCQKHKVKLLGQLKGSELEEIREYQTELYANIKGEIKERCSGSDLCEICRVSKINCALNCGDVGCYDCLSKRSICHICHEKITNLIRFQN